MGVFQAFATVSSLTLVSRVTGLAREIMIAALLGSGPVAQAFFVAFRFPNMFRRFFAEGAFNMAFVPLFAKTLEGDGRAAARDFAEEVMAGLFAVLVVLTLVAQLAMPWVILGLAYGFRDDPEKLSLAILYGQIQFPYLMFMSLMALFGGVLNGFDKFAAAAGAPILLNIVMIAGMALAASIDGDIGLWLSWSVFVGGVLQFLLVARAAGKLGMNLSLRAPRWTPRLKRLVTLGAPGALAGGVTQINILIGTVIATFFDGAVVWLTLADRVYQLPLGVVGVGIGVALLPELARRVRAGQAAEAELALSRAVALSMFVTLPAAAALVVIPKEVVRVLFGRGAFTEADVQATALAVAIFAVGLPAYVLIKALSPAFFAVEDTRTPLRYAVVSMIVNVALSVGLAPFIGWLGVAVGTVAAAYVNTILLWRGIAQRGGPRLWRDLGGRILRIASASALMEGAVSAAALWGAEYALDPLLRYPMVLGLVALGIAVYAAAAFAVGAVTRVDLAAFARARAGGDDAASRASPPQPDL
ncbi:MAG: murein biosynthesis integral membrane protein MurJ [Pseudomonadota bacterium]